MTFHSDLRGTSLAELELEPAAAAPLLELAEPASVHVCGSCGQTTIGAACDCAPDAPRHEQDRLFQPPAEQMRGQTTISGLDPQ